MDNSIKALNGIINNQSIIQNKQTVNSEIKFSDTLNNALKQVNADMNAAEVLSRQVATGDIQDLHQAMIAMEKANLGLQLTVQVRNKVVEAYQEVMRMQV